MQLYLSCLVVGVLKLTRCHGHQNYGPQLLGWSQGVQAAPLASQVPVISLVIFVQDSGLSLSLNPVSELRPRIQLPIADFPAPDSPSRTILGVLCSGTNSFKLWDIDKRSTLLKEPMSLHSPTLHCKLQLQ